MNKDSWNPKQYEKFKNERSQPFFDLMAMVETETPIERAVDLGCGTGELTQVLHEKLKITSTLGVDSSEQMLAQAKNLKSEGLSFHRGDIASFCEPGAYDLIFSNAAIQWVDGHRHIFSNLKKSLKPGGQLAVQMPMNHDFATHVIANQVALEEPFRSWLAEGPRKFPLLSAEEYAHLLYDLGFAEQKVTLKVYAHILESREGVIEWVKGTLLTYFQKQLSDEQYQKFLSEFRARLWRELPEEKPFFYPFKRLLLWAKNS